MVRNMAHQPTNRRRAEESIARYALRNAWNREQAQDIVQHAVMTAWREQHRFEQPN